MTETHTDTASAPQRSSVGRVILVPTLAVCLTLGPLAYFGITDLMRLVIWADTAVVVLVLPVIGIVLGLVTLSRGRKRNGIAGTILSIIAVVLPLASLAIALYIYASLANSEFPFM